MQTIDEKNMLHTVTSNGWQRKNPRFEFPLHAPQGSHLSFSEAQEKLHGYLVKKIDQDRENDVLSDDAILELVSAFCRLRQG